MISVGVRSHERRNELVPVWNFKPTWKQVLFTWCFFSAAFQNDPIFWWICVGISFWVVVTWYLIIRNEILFLLKWPQWNNTCNDFQAYMRINAISNEFSLFTWKSHADWKFHFDQSDRYEIHTGLSFIFPQFMWTQIKGWLNTEVRFSTDMKSHTGLSSYRFSCERTLHMQQQ